MQLLRVARHAGWSLSTPNAKAVAIEAFLYVFLFAIMFLMAVCAQRILLSGSIFTIRLRELGISHLVCHNCGFGILVVAVYFHIVILTALRTHGPSLLLLLARRTSSVLQQGKMAVSRHTGKQHFPFPVLTGILVSSELFNSLFMCLPFLFVLHSQLSVAGSPSVLRARHYRSCDVHDVAPLCWRHTVTDATFQLFY